MKFIRRCAALALFVLLSPPSAGTEGGLTVEEGALAGWIRGHAVCLSMAPDSKVRVPMKRPTR